MNSKSQSHTPLANHLDDLIERLRKIQQRDDGLYDWEASLKGQKVKPCKSIQTSLLYLDGSISGLDSVVDRSAKWLQKRREAKRKAKQG